MRHSHGVICLFNVQYWQLRSYVVRGIAHCISRAVQVKPLAMPILPYFKFQVVCRIVPCEHNHVIIRPNTCVRNWHVFITGSQITPCLQCVATDRQCKAIEIISQCSIAQDCVMADMPGSTEPASVGPHALLVSAKYFSYGSLRFYLAYVLALTQTSAKIGARAS